MTVGAVDVSVPGSATDSSGNQIATIQWNNDWDQAGIHPSGPELFHLRRADYHARNPQVPDDEFELATATIIGDNIVGMWSVTVPNGSDGGGMRVYQRNASGNREPVVSGREYGPVVSSLAGVVLDFELEGIAVSDTPFDTPFNFQFKPIHPVNSGGSVYFPPMSETVDFTVVNVDLRVDSVMHWTEEDTWGGVIPVNRDFDEHNNNGTVDVADNVADAIAGHRVVENDDELRSDTLTIETPIPGTWQFAIPDGIKVWDAHTLNEYVSGDELAISSSIALDLLIEALDYNTELYAAAIDAIFTPNETPLMQPSDDVLLTAIGLDLQVGALNESNPVNELNEEAVSSVIQSNDDHDRHRALGNDYDRFGCEQGYLTDNYKCVQFRNGIAELSVGFGRSSKIMRDDEVVDVHVTILGPPGISGELGLENKGPENGNWYWYATHGTKGRDTIEVETLATQWTERFLLEGNLETNAMEQNFIQAYFIPSNIGSSSKSHSKQLYDKARYDVIDVDISVNDFSELEEEQYPMLIRRNVDFSKGLVDASGSAIPDYAFDSTSDSASMDPRHEDDYARADIEWGGDIITGEIALTYPDTVVVWNPDTGLPIRSGVSFTPGTEPFTVLVEGIANSTSLTEIIEVDVLPTPSDYAAPQPLDDDSKIQVVEINLGVDGDRDGFIEEDNIADKEILFWYNNDREGLYPHDFSIADDVITDIDSAEADSDDFYLQHTRDLEDFTAFNVLVDAKLVGSVLDGDGDVRYDLDGDSSDVQLFPSQPGQRQDSRMHITDPALNALYASDRNMRRALVKSSDAPPAFSWRADMLRRNLAAGENAFIVEAIGGSGEMSFSADVRYPTGRVVTIHDRVDLDLRDITEFYDVYEVAGEDADGNDLRQSVTPRVFDTYSMASQSSVSTEPTFDGPDYMVLVHGWNMSDFDKTTFANTSYKRLYWQGYTGSVGAFNWPTLVDAEGWVPYVEVGDFATDFANLTFKPSEFNAYRSATALDSLLSSLGTAHSPGHVHLYAHSMGNTVVGEALRLSATHTTTPVARTYLAAQAAVSTQAYGDTAIDAFPSRQNHYRHFPAFVALAPRDYFFAGSRGAVTTWVNHFNPQDAALKAWSANNIDKLIFRVDSPTWPFDYNVTLGGNFERVWEVGKVKIEWPLQLVGASTGEIGKDAYEILSFISVSETKALGAKAIVGDGRFGNVDVRGLGLTVTMAGGPGGRANHSFQFHHDALHTYLYWRDVISQTGVVTTY